MIFNRIFGFFLYSSSRLSAKLAKLSQVSAEFEPAKEFK